MYKPTEKRVPMINAVIIEDERIIAMELQGLISKISDEVKILTTLTGVKESIDYFAANGSPDIVFSDVQLPDGLSFEIFNKANINSPVIFITAYDEFIVNAFEHNGIDYLLKPVDEKDLRKALTRYKTLEKHFLKHHSFIKAFTRKTKTRLIVKKGMENIALRTEDIVIAYTENKLVYVIDKDGRKYISDKKLTELEDELDTSTFFRANRQYIINIGFVKSYKSYEKVKLQVDLTMMNLGHQIIISQETAPDFRKWINDL